MSEARFTKEPWQRIGLFVFALRTSPMKRGPDRAINVFEAQVTGINRIASQEELEANAQLMVTAPDMYAELASILEWAVDERAPLRQQEIDSIRRVLAKARGATAASPVAEGEVGR